MADVRRQGNAINGSILPILLRGGLSNLGTPFDDGAQRTGGLYLREVDGSKRRDGACC